MLVKINNGKIINLNNVKCIEFYIDKRKVHVKKEEKKDNIYYKESTVEIVCQILFDNNIVFSELVGLIEHSYRSSYNLIKEKVDFSYNLTLLEKDSEFKTIVNKIIPIYNIFPVLMTRKEQIKNNFIKYINKGQDFDIKDCKLNEEIIFEK